MLKANYDVPESVEAVESCLILDFFRCIAERVGLAPVASNFIQEARAAIEDITAKLFPELDTSVDAWFDFMNRRLFDVRHACGLPIQPLLDFGLLPHEPADHTLVAFLG